MSEAGIAGRVAFVTGASSGLGARFARVLAASGARLVLAARREDRLAALAQELRADGAEAITVPLDVAQTSSIREAAARAEAEIGPIAILVNNAGISRQARLEEVTEDDYDDVMDTNLKGAFFMAQAAARQMIAHHIEGRIVNIASIAGLRALGQLGTYSMSKAAMVQMTHSMAREWGRHGINTNAICPGYIATEISADFVGTEGGRKLLASLPRRRLGEARDLDGLLLLLCSGEPARFLNGSVIAADDGFTSA
jgi:NAD(P)-dependent dehydrogenase (short-subunit alcohol dehydrogenase family)